MQKRRQGPKSLPSRIVFERGVPNRLECVYRGSGVHPAQCGELPLRVSLSGHCPTSALLLKKESAYYSGAIRPPNVANPTSYPLPRL